MTDDTVEIESESSRMAHCDLVYSVWEMTLGFYALFMTLFQTNIFEDFII
jgi:hypothetical protein